MKAIFVFTAALMTSASIYGVAGYSKLSKSNEFKQLYAEKKEAPRNAEVAVIEKKTEKKEAGIDEPKKTSKTAITKKTQKKKTVPAQMQKEVNEVKKPVTAKNESPQYKTPEPAKKVKKLNRKMFSRAAPGKE